MWWWCIRWNQSLDGTKSWEDEYKDSRGPYYDDIMDMDPECLAAMEVRPPVRSHACAQLAST